MPLESNNKSRRHLHTRSIQCDGFLRDDGLWEVEAWLRDTKPFTQAGDMFRGELKPGDPVHDIGLRLAIDDGMTIREAAALSERWIIGASRSRSHCSSSRPRTSGRRR